MNSGDHSGAIWVLGIFLVIAVAVTSPYWQTVGLAVATGSAPAANASNTTSGLWMTLGAFLLVAILAGLANVSEGLGGVALMLLIALWVLFLLGHTRGVQGFFSLLSPH